MYVVFSIFILNGEGKLTRNVNLTQNGIKIYTEGNVTFNGQNKNVHFVVSGDNVLINGITFKNFNYTGNGGAILWTGANGTLTECNFNNNTAGSSGGAIYWSGVNGTLSDCNFINNTAKYGDNVYWNWSVNDFLNKYDQINDFDYVYLKNGEGTPNRTVVLNKNGVTITTQGNVVFNGQGKNIHFVISGNNTLINGITFKKLQLYR